MKVIFEKIIANITKNQEMINRITMNTKIDFFDKFLSPEINLIIYILNSVQYKISVLLISLNKRIAYKEAYITKIFNSFLINI